MLYYLSHQESRWRWGTGRSGVDRGQWGVMSCFTESWVLGPEGPRPGPLSEEGCWGAPGADTSLAAAPPQALEPQPHPVPPHILLRSPGPSLAQARPTHSSSGPELAPFHCPGELFGSSSPWLPFLKPTSPSRPDAKAASISVSLLRPSQSVGLQNRKMPLITCCIPLLKHSSFCLGLP